MRDSSLSRPDGRWRYNPPPNWPRPPGRMGTAGRVDTGRGLAGAAFRLGDLGPGAALAAAAPVVGGSRCAGCADPVRRLHERDGDACAGAGGGNPDDRAIGYGAIGYDRAGGYYGAIGYYGATALRRPSPAGPAPARGHPGAGSARAVLPQLHRGPGGRSGAAAPGPARLPRRPGPRWRRHRLRVAPPGGRRDERPRLPPGFRPDVRPPNAVTCPGRSERP